MMHNRRDTPSSRCMRISRKRSAARRQAAEHRGRNEQRGALEGTSAAAPVGDGARTSATKSQIVKSVSWPHTLTTGIREWSTGVRDDSSLNAHRSSIEPPAAGRSARDLSARVRPFAIAAAISTAAPLP